VIAKISYIKLLVDPCRASTYQEEPRVSDSRLQMKVGYLSQPWDYSGPPDPGGSIGLWVWEVSRRLRRSCEVLVFAPANGRKVAIERREGVQFVRAPMTADHWLLMAAQKLWQSRDPRRSGAASDIYYKFYALRAARAFRIHKCDIVHLHNLSQFAPVVRRINRQARIVLHMHCDWLVQFDRDLINARLADIDAIVGSSEYITRAIRRHFPLHANQCVTIHNGVDIRVFHPATNDSVFDREHILYIGRLSPEKGVHLLLDALEQVVRTRPNTRLELIGGPGVVPIDFIVNLSDDPIVRKLSRFYRNEDYVDFLRRRVRAGLETRVFFTGQLPHRQLSCSIRGAALVVAPSLVESFGMPVAETMASGVPVVASRVGGLPELVIDGTTGLLVDPDNPAALSQAILRILDDRASAQAMGRAGRRRAEKLFAWEKIVETLLALYKELAQQSRDELAIKARNASAQSLL
jgi:glycosyltransferase involved in cell wall biosynthesis